MVPGGRRRGGSRDGNRGKAEKSWLRHVAEDAKSSDKGKPGEGGQPSS